jgi:hypothetical protein
MKMGIEQRLHDIIVKCQVARKKYGFDYEERYQKDIQRFSEEIIKKDLISKCADQEFAKQLCITNSLNWE